MVSDIRKKQMNKREKLFWFSLLFFMFFSCYGKKHGKKRILFQKASE